MKSQVSTTEMILALIVLFLAFTVLFPEFSYRTGWDEARLGLKSRDILSTIDRIGKTYTYSFFPQNFKTEFLDKIAQQDIIVNSQTEDAVKNQIFVACSCTTDQINYLQTQLADAKFNDRTIKINYCYTDLDKINPCSIKINYPDVLIIWGYNDLSIYEAKLKELLDKGNAIIEITDFDNFPDNTQKRIFGIDGTGTGPQIDYDTIPKPASGVEITYQPYKFFYHAPFPLKASEEVLRQECSIRNMTGSFKLWYNNYLFSICDGNAVQFDTNADGILDSPPLIKGSLFNLQNPTGTYSFTLSYIQENEIGVSFKPVYKFTDFCRVPGKKKIIPLNNEYNRVFMYGIKNGAPETYCTILNGTVGKTAWVSDFSRDGLTNIGDDHGQLLLSLILSLSNKKPKEKVDMGTVTSLIDVNNTDVFEVYKFNLGLKHPF